MLIRYELSDFDNRFWDMCRKEFQLTGDFDSHDRLFKAILSYLEHNERERALRIQALYLFARGVRVAAMGLALYYGLIYIMIQYRYLPSTWYAVLRPQWVMLVGTLSMYGLLVILDKNREELEEDWIEYTITECYMEMLGEP